MTDKSVVIKVFGVAKEHVWGVLTQIQGCHFASIKFGRSYLFKIAGCPKGVLASFKRKGWTFEERGDARSIDDLK